MSELSESSKSSDPLKLELECEDYSKLELEFWILHDLLPVVIGYLTVYSTYMHSHALPIGYM
jgi:hypothetical protein